MVMDIFSCAQFIQQQGKKSVYFLNIIWLTAGSEDIQIVTWKCFTGKNANFQQRKECKHNKQIN